MTIRFVFAGDPMCSWCYGFASELAKALTLLPPIELDLCMAGIWANGEQLLDEQAKQFRLSHWARVEEASGVSFNREALLARENFIYNTEPISRAFVAGKHLVPELYQLRLFQALQRAFYIEGLDTTDDAILTNVLKRELAAQGYSGSVPLAGLAMDSAEVFDKTQQDFEEVRSWQLTGFPKLLAVRGEQSEVLLDGFVQAPHVVKKVLARLN
jgi:putative protein-disulfide isomerase